MSTECRTLADMSDDERAAIEKQYKCKIHEGGLDTPVDQMGDVQLLMRASAASVAARENGKPGMTRTRRMFLKEMGASHRSFGRLTDAQREALREIVREAKAAPPVSREARGDQNSFAAPSPVRPRKRRSSQFVL